MREWYLMSWPEECPDCNEFSKVAKCPHCGIVKPIDEETVTDEVVVRELEKFNKKTTEKIERKLDEEER